MTTQTEPTLSTLFLDAHTYNAFAPTPVDDALLARIYDLARMGPTAANIQPLRLTYVKTAEAKAKLLPTLSPGNVEKTRTAPVTAILAWDAAFYEQMPKLFPARDMKTQLGSLPSAVRDGMATTSAALQGGYFILAARALGLDAGPMGGFDQAAVNAAFFAGTEWRSFLLVNLGHGDPAGLYPRNPRLDFAEAGRIE